ncbi:MAG: hypothetical protein ACOY93_21935 [Bacillota bacterium]
MAWVLTVIGYFVFYTAVYWITGYVLSLTLTALLAPGAMAQEAAASRPGVQRWILGFNTVTTGLAGAVFRFAFAVVVVIATAFFNHYFPYAQGTVAIMAGFFTFGALQSFGYGVLTALALWVV